MKIMHCNTRTSHNSPGAKSVQQQWGSSLQFGGGSKYLPVSAVTIFIQKCWLVSQDRIDIEFLPLLSYKTLNIIILIFWIWWHPVPDLFAAQALADRDKQNNQLREQRDRAEKELKEEKELHERELAEYKMKIHSYESEVTIINNGFRLET